MYPISHFMHKFDKVSIFDIYINIIDAIYCYYKHIEGPKL